MANFGSDDYYEVLGLRRDADESGIKKAYHKLAMKWHPDKNGGSEESNANFQKISEAYEVLSDENKRSNFDRFGRDGASQGHREQGSGGGGNFHFSSHGGNFQDPHDVFKQFFGGRDPFADFMNDDFFGGGMGGGGMRGGGMGGRMGGMGGGMGGMFGGGMDDFFGGGGMGGMGGMGGGNMSSFSSFSSMGGAPGSTSTSTVTTIRNGKKVTKKTVTRTLADGSQQTSTEEFEGDAPQGAGMVGGSSGFARLGGGGW